jgi:hypothetical protein
MAEAGAQAPPALGGGAAATAAAAAAAAAAAGPACHEQQRRRRRRHGLCARRPAGATALLPLLPLLLLLLVLVLVARAPTPAAAASSSSAFFRIFYPSASANDHDPPRTAPLPKPEDPNRDGGRTAPHSAGLSPQASVTALYCPNGGALEGGLCYVRCRLGWRGVGCTCWKDGLTYARGCGQRPAVCEATSFRRNPLPPIVGGGGGGGGAGDGGGGAGEGDFASALAAARGQEAAAAAAAAAGAAGGDGGAGEAAAAGAASSSPSGGDGGDGGGGGLGASAPTTAAAAAATTATTTTSVTLVLSTDPQLFRNGSSPDARALAVDNNRLLARSINRVRDLGAWPRAAGGGAVAEPRALVVLGDLTEAYREREADAFRHYYDPSFPGNEGERVRFPTWVMLGNHDYVNNAMGAVSARELAEGARAQEEQRQQQPGAGAGAGAAAAAQSSPPSSSDPAAVEAPLSADYDEETSSPEVSSSSSSSGSGSGRRSKQQQQQQQQQSRRRGKRGDGDAPCSDKAAVAGDGSACAKRVVDEMRALLSPGCPTRHWSSFPKDQVTSFDADSMAYAFDYARYHFVALHFSPRHRSARLGVAGSLAWLARELSHASGQGRRAVILVHSHGELGLTDDPTFARLIGGAGSPVVALFFGHIHVRPWGYAGTFPRTAVPMFNCGASWYNTYCVAEFAEEGMRVGAVSHGGDGSPRWFGHSAHLLPAPGAPLAGDGSGGGGGGGGAAAAAAARSTGVAPPPAKPALLAYEPNPKGSPWLKNGVA